MVYKSLIKPLVTTLVEGYPRKWYPVSFTCVPGRHLVGFYIITLRFRNCSLKASSVLMLLSLRITHKPHKPLIRATTVTLHYKLMLANVSYELQ